MDNHTLQLVVEELRAELVGRALGRIFQLARRAFACDFRPHTASRFLYIAVEPHAARLYLIERKLREIERQEAHVSMFAQLLRKHLGGATLTQIDKPPDERVVFFRFDATDELDHKTSRTLVAQLTGRSANLLLLDADERIIERLNSARAEVTDNDERYELPRATSQSLSRSMPTGEAIKNNSTEETTNARAPVAAVQNLTFVADQSSISRTLDEHYTRLASQQRFAQRATEMRSRFEREIKRFAKLKTNLARDLSAHGDAETHKRAGDLLLANISTHERDGNRVRVQDFFTDGAPIVEYDIDAQHTIQEEAAHRFQLYGKAKRAKEEIGKRAAQVEAEIAALVEQQTRLAEIVESQNEAALEDFAATKKTSHGKSKNDARDQSHAKDARKAKRGEPSMTGIRRYLSSDGFEMLLGRGAKENDQLTFRVARSNDLWLHAADYAGAHVVVKNSARKEIPQRTVIEAAQLAAFNSQARDDSKVSVNYTERKFVSKPKNAPPGLVRLSSFRTLLVEPRGDFEKITS